MEHFTCRNTGFGDGTHSDESGYPVLNAMQLDNFAAPNRGARVAPFIRISLERLTGLSLFCLILIPFKGSS